MTMNLRKIFNASSDTAVFFFLLFTILPFLILSAYVHPSWDDFDYSEMAVKYGFFHSQYLWYETWSGRYFSTAVLSSINPLVFRSISGYKIITLIFILLFIYSVYYLITNIALDKISRKQKLICTLSFCYLFFYGMPTVNLGLFWLASAVIYQFANIMMTILAALFIKFLLIENEKISFSLIASICILIFAVEGSNEVSMLVTTIFFLIYFIGDSVTTRKINKYLLIFAAVAAVSCCLVYFAPGNNYRLTKSPESHQLIFSLKNSASDLFKFILYRIYNLPLLIFTVLFISFYYKLISDKKPDEIKIITNPVYSVSMYLFLLFSGIFVSYWSLGTYTPYRTLNVIYFIFLTGWFANIIITINYLYAKGKIKIRLIPEYAFVILCIAVLISFLKETNSIKTAYRDLFSGKAEKFDAQLNDRYKNIYSNNSDTVKIDSLKQIPDSFFYYDIGSDPEGKYNKLQSEYFNKKFIIKPK